MQAAVKDNNVFAFVPSEVQATFVTGRGTFWKTIELCVIDSFDNGK